jgi:hypothetical protein
VQAPQEQGNTAHQVKKNNASHQPRASVSMLVPLGSLPMITKSSWPIDAAFIEVL